MCGIREPSISRSPRPISTTLDVIDTAVKVGLGAAISGIATYFATVRSHRHELKKLLVTDTRALLKDAATKLESASSLLNQTIFSILDLRRGSAADRDVLFDQRVGEVIKAYNQAKEARALCYLAGEKSLADSLTPYVELISDMRKQYANLRFDYDPDQIDANTHRRTAIKSEVLVSLGAAFQSCGQAGI